MEAERVLLNWIDQDGVSHCDDGVCIDLARKGIMFDYKHPFALGELVEVTFNPHTPEENSVKVKSVAALNATRKAIILPCNYFNLIRAMQGSWGCSTLN